MFLRGEFPSVSLLKRRQGHFAADLRDAAPVQRCQGTSQRPGRSPGPSHPGLPRPPRPSVSGTGTGTTGAGPEPFWKAGGKNRWGECVGESAGFFGVRWFFCCGFFEYWKKWNEFCCSKCWGGLEVVWLTVIYSTFTWLAYVTIYLQWVSEFAANSFIEFYWFIVHCRLSIKLSQSINQWFLKLWTL